MGKTFLHEASVPWTGSSFSQDAIFCEVGDDLASFCALYGGKKACGIHSILVYFIKTESLALLQSLQSWPKCVPY